MRALCLCLMLGAAAPGAGAEPKTGEREEAARALRTALADPHVSEFMRGHPEARLNPHYNGRYGAWMIEIIQQGRERGFVSVNPAGDRVLERVLRDPVGEEAPKEREERDRSFAPAPSANESACSSLRIVFALALAYAVIYGLTVCLFLWLAASRRSPMPLAP